MQRTFNPEIGATYLKYPNINTYRDLLKALRTLSEEQLDMKITLYDEEPDIFWNVLEFVISEVGITDNDGLDIEQNQPLFFLPR